MNAPAPGGECHAPGCNRDTMTATRCDCGFIARVIAGDARIAGGERGQGARMRYAVEVGHPSGTGACPEEEACGECARAYALPESGEEERA